MGSTKGATHRRRNRAEEGRTEKHKSSKSVTDNKATERELQARAADAKELVRIKNKALYRDSKPDGILSKLADSLLLCSPRLLTVEVPGGRRALKAYSIVMAAKALGKSVIQIRVWIKKGLIPAPALKVVNHGYFVYDYREMQIIRTHLYRHSKTGVSYLTPHSIGFVDKLQSDISEYREQKYGH